MSLRLKLLVLFTLAVAAAAGVTAWNAERYAARQYQQAGQQRSDTLVAQFRRELSEREAEVTTSIQTIADAESTVRMVLALSGPQGDPSIYGGDARGLAAARQLDFLELATTDGTLISSAQWPDHIGTKETWLTHENDWNQRGAFISRVELPARVDLGLISVRMVHAGNLNLYIVGGQRLDTGFLRTLSLPEGMRALLYRNLDADFAPADLSDADGAVNGAEAFAPLIQSLQKQPVRFNGPNGPAATAGPDAEGSAPSVSWSADSASAERFVAVPLTGKQGEFLGALLLGSPQGELVAFENNVGGAAVLATAAGLVLAIFLSWWIEARVSRPLKRLTEGIGEVAAGDWDAQVEAGSVREVQRPVVAFNKMTKQLADERAGQVARERAAAWRQLAGQLAAELRTLLPPLQSAVEGLARSAAQAEPGAHAEPAAHAQEDAEGFAAESPEQMGMVGSAVRQTLETLAACAVKLGEFAALPVPRLEAVNVNETVRAAVQSFESQFSAIGRPPITPELYLDERAGQVRADPVLLRKVFENLLLFVIEDMPAGGTFSIYTRRQEDMAHIVLSHSGASAPRLSHSGASASAPRGESGRALDRAARVSGIGLSLATVQSIVSSHGGKISIETAPLAGTTFYLDWPVVAAMGGGAAAQPMAPIFSDGPQQPEAAVRRQREADQPNQPRMAPAEPQAAQMQEAQKQEARQPEEHRPEEPKLEEQGETVKAEPALEQALEPGLERVREQSLAEKPGEAREPGPESEPEPGTEPEPEPEQAAAQVQLHEMEQPAGQDELGVHQQREAQLTQEQREEQPLPLPELVQQAESPAGMPAAAPAMAFAAERAEAPAEADEAPEAAGVVAATSETQRLAAVIEEVFKTPAHVAKAGEVFADENEGEAESIKQMGRESLQQRRDSLIEVSVVSGQGALGGMFAPETRPETLDDALAGWYADSVPQLFGVPVPAAIVDASNDEEGQNETVPIQTGEAEPHSAPPQNAPSEDKSVEVNAAAFPEQAAPESVGEAAPATAPQAPAKTSEEQIEHGEQDQRPALTYSPLTYRW